MSNWKSDLTSLAVKWEELRAQWNAWDAEKRQVPLRDETQAYFTRFTGRVFYESLEEVAHSDHVPGLSPEDAWARVLYYFHDKRPVSGKYVMDDIFKNAYAKAKESKNKKGENPPEWERLETFLGWVIKQFKMRVREVAESYARESGVASLRGSTTSADEPIKSDSGNEGADDTFYDRYYRDSEFGSEAEREELLTLGAGLAEAFFPQIRWEFRLVLFLKLQNLESGGGIRLTDPRVHEATKLRPAVLYDGYHITRQGWKIFLAEAPAWVELDRFAQNLVECHGWQQLQPLCESWCLSEERLSGLFNR